MNSSQHRCINQASASEAQMQLCLLNSSSKDTVGSSLVHLDDQLLNDNTSINPNARHSPLCTTFATSLILGSPILSCTVYFYHSVPLTVRHFKNVSILDSKANDHAFLGLGCQVIYSQFGLAIHQNDHQVRRRFVEWAQNEMAVVPDFHKRILLSDEAHFWLNGYVNKQNCRIWSEANPQVYVETPLHPEKLTVGCALWAGGILLQKR
ncbi:transposable element Tc3 transposase [Trichonephila clavipes]|nr:transposable element Tc3 transposase [Trichonephila clavipes]